MTLIIWVFVDTSHTFSLRSESAARGDNPKDIEMNIPIQIEIDNLKCGGCEKSIVKGLSAMPAISDLVVDREHQVVRFSGAASDRDAVVQKLRSMGYPEKGSLAGMEAGLANAKSFVSCAVGRMS
jgi:copper chaperone